MIAPIIISIAIPPISSYWLISSWLFRCMKDYFSYEEIFEISDADLIAYKKPMILAGVPHGVISYGGLCAGTGMVPEFANLKTGVASVVLKMPIIKHLLGVFNLIDVGQKSLERHIRDKSKSSIDRSIVIYTGGIAELFKCSTNCETLVARKGFIKVALREGMDIVPIYFFGNTSVLSIPKNKLFEKISRKMQMSLTWFYGPYFLPVPRPSKLLYVRGKPIVLPKLQEHELTDDVVQKYYSMFLDEVTRIFNQYKGRVPGYGNKTLNFDEEDARKKK